MHYHISHTTRYTYNQPVFLKPHLLRLYPRCDGWQKLNSFSLLITPEPVGISYINDLDGNTLVKVWFTTATEKLEIQITAKVETYKSNPFDYLLEPWALQLPFDYSNSLSGQLQPYLQSSAISDTVAINLAQKIYHQVNGETLSFLSSLNQHIYENCTYITRETGEPWLPGITWEAKQGSCRDVAVLFMEACRAVGLATRFVSGYQEGDPEQTEHELHAWVEVYLPGGGWRGYDPSHGLVVADRHIALVSSALSSYASPISGHVLPVQPTFTTGKTVQSQLEVNLSVIGVE